MHLIVSCSLNKNSKSKILANYASTLYNQEVKFLDLQTMELPFCDGDSCYDNPKVKELSNLVKESKSIIIASPIYMYDLNAAAKNFMELTGRAWTKKVVGFICAAGGKGSYMSVTSYMNSLMLDFRCIVVPRFVYTDRSGFDENYNIKSNIKERIEELVDQITLLSSKIDH
ncbi:MAG: flavoprotein [Candidatus Marinimicrobia bacterium]|nr:flavoprotein [Candidatus Neomarinimicrobiota bacterium]|tara:strand:- start:3920 stop:4432 length:513 start_codon:yes stop_codon:yes gene_type:complete